jgi:gentisate 1,2-dioxygenase
MERERERNVSYDEYQRHVNFEAKMIAERLKAKRIVRTEDINVQWNGHGFVYYPPEWPLKMIRCFIEELPPLGHNVEHKHLDEAVVYCVKGRGHAFIGGTTDEERATTVGEKIPFKEGDFLMVPSNIWHTFYNDDDTEWLRFMGIVNPILEQIGLMVLRHHGKEGRDVVPPDDIRKLAAKRFGGTGLGG